MDRDELLALADRCEAATGADTELDALIYMRADAENGSFETRYTASLDAAMTLVEVDEYWRLGNDGEGPDPADFKATVTSHDGVADMHFHDAVAATPALALCAAALRVKASQ